MKPSFDKWLRELDLNQRPSGYECGLGVIPSFILFNKINGFRVFLIKIKLYKTTQKYTTLHKYYTKNLQPYILF